VFRSAAWSLIFRQTADDNSILQRLAVITMKDELLFLVDEDTAAFNKVMDAFTLPKDSAEEKPPAPLPPVSQQICVDSTAGHGNGLKSYEILGGHGAEIPPQFQMLASACHARWS
jgi:hypothetical protein